MSYSSIWLLNSVCCLFLSASRRFIGIKHVKWFELLATNPRPEVLNIIAALCLIWISQCHSHRCYYVLGKKHNTHRDIDISYFHDISMIWGFPGMGLPQMDACHMKNPTKIDALGVPSGNLWHRYWSHGPVEIVTFPMKNGDFAGWISTGSGSGTFRRGRRGRRRRRLAGSEALGARLHPGEASCEIHEFRGFQVGKSAN